MPYQTLHLEFAGEIATITLNRPEKRNAISSEMIAEILAAFSEVEASPARVLIITGAGKAFCSGMDLDALKALATQSPAEHLEDARRLAQMCRRIWSFPKLTIAAVNGHAIAGGCGIATLCDFTIAVPEAKFGYPEVRIGFLPGPLGRLPGLVAALPHAVSPLPGKLLLVRIGPFLCHLSSLFGPAGALLGQVCCFLGLLGNMSP